MNKQFTYDNRVSVEFFPPRDAAGMDRLKDTAEKLLKTINPSYASVTFGAGGSTQDGTRRTVSMISDLSYEAVPHISCIGSSVEQMYELLDYYKSQSIKKVVALRGDLPSGMGAVPELSELRYASDLVRVIRQHSGDWFHISVGAYPEVHPQATSAHTDLEYFIKKVEEGADSAITQYFYNADAYFDFVERLRAKNINIPVVAGIMPINNFMQIARFSQMCGAEVPRWMRERCLAYGDDRASLQGFAQEIVARLGERLLEQGAPGLHFYTLNQADAVINIWQQIKNTVPR